MPRGKSVGRLDPLMLESHDLPQQAWRPERPRDSGFGARFAWRPAVPCAPGDHDVRSCLSPPSRLLVVNILNRKAQDFILDQSPLHPGNDCWSVFGRSRRAIPDARAIEACAFGCSRFCLHFPPSLTLLERTSVACSPQQSSALQGIGIQSHEPEYLGLDGLGQPADPAANALFDRLPWAVLGDGANAVAGTGQVGGAGHQPHSRHAVARADA